METNTDHNFDSLKGIYVPLTLGGSLPFLFAAVAPYLNIYHAPFVGNIQHAITVYALVILSFMAGAQWGLSLGQEAEKVSKFNKPLCPKQLMIGSNIMALIPWVVLCALGPGITFYFVVAITFVILLLIDYRLANRNIVTHDYCKVRIGATGIVVISLISLAFTA